MYHHPHNTLSLLTKKRTNKNISITSERNLIKKQPTMTKKKVANRSKNGSSKTKKHEMKKRTTLVHAKTKPNQLNMNRCSRRTRKAEEFNMETDNNVRNGVEEDQKCCHQCGEKGKTCVIDCEKCGSNRYCVDCRAKWYPNVSEEEFVKACPICRSIGSCNTFLLGFLKGPVDDLQFAKVPDILNGDDANLCNHNNGWLDESDATDISTDKLNQEQFLNDVIDISSSTSISKNDSDPLQTTDNVVDQETDSFENSNETEGKYRGHIVGVAEKQLLQAIELQYPEMFNWKGINSRPFWLDVLKELYTVIKGFLDTLPDDFKEDQISKLQERLGELKTTGFDLSWVDERLEMIKKLKLEYGPLKQDLMVMEESIQLLQEKVVERKKQYMEALDMLEKAQSEYDSAKKARDDEESELRQKLGDNYELLLNGPLGSGMLPKPTEA